MNIEFGIKLDFKDVLIKPRLSELSDNSQVDLERTINFPNSNISWTGIPIIASNMNTIGTYEMYKVLSSYKMITAFHKFYTLQDFRGMNLDPDYFMISTGITNRDFLRLIEILENIECKFICIDIENGYMKMFQDFCLKIREKYPSKIIVAGNVVSKDITDILINQCGVDIVKVGIGNGSVSTSRIKTGVGMPQVSAIDDCSQVAHSYNSYIISDGGITCPGDLAKGFSAGADFIMIGGVFSGHEENTGELLYENEQAYKFFYGMESQTLMDKNYDGKLSYEGKTVKIKYKGSISNTIEKYLDGLRSTCVFVNARNLEELFYKSTFVIVKNQYNDVYEIKKDYSEMLF